MEQGAVIEDKEMIEMTFTPDDRVATVRRFIDEVWNGGRSDAIEAYMAPDYVDRAYTPASAEGHRAMVETLKSVMPDGRWSIDAIGEKDGIVMVELTLTGTHLGPFRALAATGNDIRVRGYRSFVFAGDRIVEHRALLDTHALLQQMQPRPA